MMGNKNRVTLPKNDHLYHAFFDISPDPMAITDVDSGCLIDVNQAFVTWSRYSRDELIGHTTAEVGIWADDESGDAILKRLRNEGFVDEAEIELRRKGGELRRIVFSGKLIEIEHDKWFIFVGRDITEHKQMEGGLREASDYLENLLNYANAPVIVWDARFQVTRFNRAFERLTGRSAVEVLGQELNLLFPDDTRQASLDYIRSTTGEHWETAEIPIQHIDGTVHTLLWNSATIFSDDGKTPVATIAQGQDITRRKRVEGELRETNEYLDNLFNYANAPIITWDPQFSITRFNHAFESITGRRTEDVFGASIEILFPPSRVEDSMELIRKTLTGERWETVEIDILNLDGTVRTLLWNSATIFSDDGRTPVATIAQGQDITGRKRAEGELKDRYNELNCLFGISSLMELSNVPLDEILNRIVALIPPSLRFPEVSAACITLEGQTLQTAGFRETPWMVACEIIVNGRPVGRLEICYLGETWAGDGEPFSKEEQNLLKAIGERVSQVIERINAEEVLRKKEAELMIKSNNLEEMNTALNVLMNKIEKDKIEIEEKVLANVNRLVFPYIDKLKNLRLGPTHTMYVDIIEANLNNIVSPFLQKLGLEYVRLTPTEIRIANLIKSGRKTNEIAEVLKMSTGAINFHRNNIRKKLGLNKEKVNLAAYLLSLQ